MTVNKGLLSLADNSPNFSNQALENAVNSLKVGWVQKSFDLDAVIASNTVLSVSQKTDLKSEINNVAHINLGRALGDLIRHTDTIIDATIIPLDDASNPTPSTFLEILQNVQTLQGLIPSLYGVSASDKNKGVNDHLGTLNNILLTTEDSSRPVFTTLLDSITFINNAGLATETALGTAYDNLRNFINDLVSDSTDFQQSLDTFSTAVATAHTNFNNALASQPYLTHRTALTNMEEKISQQVALENNNLTGIVDYVSSVSDKLAYASLAEDVTLRGLMAKVSQNKQWQTYFEDYAENEDNLNPIYNTSSDSDKSALIDQLLTDAGLPDVTDTSDFEAIADKAKRDTRISTKDYDTYTVEQQITESCVQLGITTANRTISHLANELLNNLNQHDRDTIARSIDSNEESETLS